MEDSNILPQAPIDLPQEDNLIEQQGDEESSKKDVDETTTTTTLTPTAEINNITMEESGETTDTSSEKNESKDYIDDDELFQCKDCEVTQCVMWRKALDKDGLVCNLCHLKRIKNKICPPAQPQTTLTLTAGTCSTSTSVTSGATKSSSQYQMQPPVKAKDVRISKRKNKTNKKFTSGLYSTDRLIKTNHSKSRRAFFKKKPQKSEVGISSIVASQSIYHNGLLYRVGDVVCTSDVEGGGTYYAQLRGFLQDEFCERAAVITWLIPTARDVTKFDPMLFVPGLDEETPRSMDCFDFVCRASTSLFKSQNAHPPYLRSQSNLDNLIYVANALNTSQQQTQT